MTGKKDRHITETGNLTMSNTVRRAEERDIPAIMELLKQVDEVHHAGRPDLFKLATKRSPT